MQVGDRRAVQGLAQNLGLGGEESAYLRRALDYTYDWEYWVDPQGRLIYSSPSCERITGRKPSDFIASPDLMRRLIHPADRTAYDKHVREQGLKHKPGAAEWRIRHTDGHYRWIGHTCQSVFDDHGRHLGVRASNRDITDRKQAEESLRQLTATLEQRVVERTAALQANLDAIRRLHKLGLLSAQESSLPQVLEEILDAAIAITGAAFGTIQLLDPASGDLQIAAHSGFPKWWIKFWNNVSKGQGVCGTALQRGRRVIVEDVTKSPIFVGTPALQIQLKAGVRAVQSTPLVSRSGKVLGMFSTHYKTPHRPDARTLSLLDLLARQAADLIEHTQAEKALRQSEERYRALAQASSDVVYRMSADWREMRHLVGREFIPDTTKPSRTWLQKYIFPEDQRHVMSVIHKAIRTKSVFELEHRVRRADGSVGWTFSRAIPMLDASGKILEWFGTASDVTARKQAEAALRASEAHFRTIFDTVGDGMLLFDLKRWRIHLANKACLNMLGYTMNELAALDLDDLHFKEDLPFIHAEIDKFRHAQTAPQAEIRFRRKDGSTLDTELYPTALRLNSHEFVLVTIRDISERKRLQAEVERVSEMERQRLGRDLHDGLSQHLAAMAMLGGAMTAALRKKGLPEAADAAKFTENAREAVTLTHDLSRSLYPASLQIGGLPVALEELALLVEKMFSIRCRLHNDNKGRLADANLERQLFRIAQEAAFNAAKHSKGRHIWIRFHRSKHWLTLTIRDDGIGVAAAKLEAHDLGLNIMHYRAGLIGATLTFSSKPWHGTTITCKLRYPTT